MHQTFPVLRFRCRFVYLTPNGKLGGVVYHVASIAADLAMRDGEAILREDKRRRIAQIITREAVQC